MIFVWEQREEDNNINSSRSDISILLTLLSADGKSAVLLRFLSEVPIPVGIFSQMTLFGSWTAFYACATCEKVGHM